MSPDPITLLEEARIAIRRSNRETDQSETSLVGLITRLIELIESSATGEALITAHREIRQLKTENKRAFAACKSAYESISRFPGSVHDRAMAKLDRVVHPQLPRVYPEVDAEADYADSEKRRILEGLLDLGVKITPEIDLLLTSSRKV